MGRLRQGIGTGADGTVKRVDGTDTFHVIHYKDIPHDHRKEITNTSVVCKVFHQKDKPNLTRTTVGGDRICYPGDMGTDTTSIKLVKLTINSVLSRRGAEFVCFYVQFFYLGTPLDRPEYAKIRLSNTPQEFSDEYNLTQFSSNGWIYFNIQKGIYVLPQFRRLANDQLCAHLEKEGYYEAYTTPGLWRHKWHPIMFSLIVN